MDLEGKLRKQWEKSKAFMRVKVEDGKEYKWFSVCSRHMKGRDGCIGCETGVWVEREAHIKSHILYETDYEAWYEKKNAPDSESKKRLESWFPGLRTDKDNVENSAAPRRMEELSEIPKV